MNAHLLIDAVVQQTMVFIAELATAGGVRAPLAHVAEQVFLDLTRELSQLRQLSAKARLSEAITRAALTQLVADGRVQETAQAEDNVYSADRFEVPLGAAVGWQAAVFDHYQALVTAVITKLKRGAAAGRPRDQVGGSTWSLDVWPGHPLEDEAKGLLSAVRQQAEALRTRIDAVQSAKPSPARERVVFYVGQYVRDAGPAEDDLNPEETDDA